ncbi:hypothetical protein LCGC14_1518420 [marine sediment metagenome]|uniref:Uncharacterized protein n=1 Tax=marine sediment metagenome TaxID=412755 RepID=A0A0F9IZF4_9ZZZZ
MKIRCGFVSNSSSSAYILLLKKDFQFTDEQIEEIIGETGLEEERDEEMKGALNSALEHLKNGKDVWIEELPGCMGGAIAEALPDDLILTTVEMGPDAGQLINILTDEYVEKFQKALE